MCLDVPFCVCDTWLLVSYFKQATLAWTYIWYVGVNTLSLKILLFSVEDNKVNMGQITKML